MGEHVLSQAVEDAIIIYEKEIGNYASRTREMIEREGAINALSKLMLSPDLQQGFKVLRDSNLLNKTFEAVVVEFAENFSKEVVEMAQWRLDNPYDLLDIH